MFYGSELEVGDLPLPRKKNHDWALLHEESPKNNFVFCMPNVSTYIDCDAFVSLIPTMHALSGSSISARFFTTDPYLV